MFLVAVHCVAKTAKTAKVKINSFPAHYPACQATALELARIGDFVYRMDGYRFCNSKFLSAMNRLPCMVLRGRLMVKW